MFDIRRFGETRMLIFRGKRGRRLDLDAGDVF
jgi:hypothetical protein